MKWPRLLSSPPPDSVWSFDSETAIVLRRDSKLGNRCAARELPPEVFGVGPAGLHSVDSEKLESLLSSLHHSVQSSRRPAIVLPTAWTRVFLMEGKELPGKRHELEDVIRWRLKKLLPISPTELRLSITDQQLPSGSRRILCAVGLNKALLALEAAFQSIGQTPGLILPRILALSLNLEGMPARRLIVQQESGFFSLALVVEGGLQFLRTKPLPIRGEKVETLAREISMAMSFIHQTLEVEEEVEALLVTGSSVLSDALITQIKEIDGLRPSALPWPDACTDPVLSGSLGQGRIEAMGAVLEGGRP